MHHTPYAQFSGNNNAATGALSSLATGSTARDFQLADRVCMTSLCGVPGPHFCFAEAKLSFRNRLYWLGARTLAGVLLLLNLPRACSCPLHALHTCLNKEVAVKHCSRT